MRKLAYTAINTFTFLIVLYANYRFGMGEGELPSVGEVSARYPTLFTPAGYAFSIWGVIYMFLLVYLVNQWYAVLTDASGQSINNAGIWFFMSNAMNSLWIVVWTMEYLFLSLVVMGLLLFCLAQLIRKLKLEIYDAPFSEIITVWWPIVIYFGWIVLAFMVNLAVVMKYLLNLNALVEESTWTIVFILLAMAAFVVLTFLRNLREACLVGAWGLAAIAVRQWEVVPRVAYVAGFAAGILVVVAMVHALMNFESSPLKKLFGINT